MSAPWSEREDISAQVEDANAAARGEVASQRRADAHLIADEGPSAAELDEEYFVYEQRAREWWA